MHLEIGPGTKIDTYTKPGPECPRCSLTIDNLEEGKSYSVNVAIIYKLANGNMVKTSPSKSLEISTTSISTIGEYTRKMLRKSNIKNEQYNAALNNQKRQNNRIKKMIQDVSTLSQKINKIQQAPSNKKHLTAGSYIPNYTQLGVNDFIHPDGRNSSVVRVVGDNSVIIS